jgi:hypothetical protein
LQFRRKKCDANRHHHAVPQETSRRSSCADWHHYAVPSEMQSSSYVPFGITMQYAAKYEFVPIGIIMQFLVKHL